MIDRISCWMEVIPLDDITAEVVVKHFMKIGYADSEHLITLLLIEVDNDFEAEQLNV